MQNDEEMYDEFGNLINGSNSSSESEDELNKNLSDIAPGDEQLEESSEGDETDEEGNHKQLVAHTPHNNGLTLSQRFGPNVSTVIAKKQEISDEPVIKPNLTRKGKIEIMSDEQLPKTRYSKEYMINIAKEVPEIMRNVAIVGSFHSGKTSLMDLLISETHELDTIQNVKTHKPMRFTDNHILEIKRGMSIKLSSACLLLPNSKGKSYVFNFIDTPGHIGFKQEANAGLEAVDGCVLVVDAVEGLTFRDKIFLNEILERNLPFTLVINKIDRLILELRLPPSDCYYKLYHIIHEVNQYINQNPLTPQYSYDTILSPELNNVIFSSTSLRFCFTLESFTQLYFELHDLTGVDLSDFSKRLWGNNYYDNENNKFIKSSNNGKYQRSFVHFILEPIYKIITHTITRDNNKSLLSKLLFDNFRITLTKKQLSIDSQLLIPQIFGSIFPLSTGFVDVILSSVPSQNNSELNYPVVFDKPIQDNKFIAKVIKMVESPDGKTFSPLVKVLLGSIKIGDEVKVFNEFFNQEKEVTIEKAEKITIPVGRYNLNVTELSPGCIGLISGIGRNIYKYGIVIDVNIDTHRVKSIKTIDYTRDSVVKVALEPKIAKEVPRLTESLKCINKAYLASKVKVEENGEHVLLGTSEIQLDCMMHDLRFLFSDNLEINVTEPMVTFSETVSETSVTKITNKIPNGVISLSIICEPIDNLPLSKAIETGVINLNTPIKELSRLLRNKYQVDSLESRSYWSFGPDDLKQPDILIDDTLESEVDKQQLKSIKESIEIGFQWACNEGPLCEEPIRNVKFKILDAEMNQTPPASQIIPLTRRACYTGFLTASPKMMEPIFTIYITCTNKVSKYIADMVSKRRGLISFQEPIPGTELFNFQGEIPVIDSFGFETDLRLQTQGHAMCYFDFSKYDIVPGNPMDSEVYLPDLKPVPPESMARDFMIKTRKRKGITGDPSLQKYIDDDLYEKLKLIGLL